MQGNLGSIGGRATLQQVCRDFFHAASLPSGFWPTEAMAALGNQVVYSMECPPSRCCPLATAYRSYPEYEGTSAALASAAPDERVTQVVWKVSLL